VAVELFWLRELAAAGRTSAEVGGKARHVGLLCAAGLPVPEGFVLPTGTGSWPPGDDRWAELGGIAASRLGSVLAVRSSSEIEDRADGAAPGLFSSRLNIRPADLARAVTDVRGSAGSAAVVAYLERRGLVRPGGSPPDLAVIVQRQVGRTPGSARGVLYTRPPGHPDADEIWIEAARPDGLVATARALRTETTGRATSRPADSIATAPWADPDFPLSSRELAALVDLGLAAELVIAAGSGADVEWVAEPNRGEDARLWLVQARPIRHGPVAQVAAAPAESDPLGFSRGDVETLWRWDAAHNPDPLTPAQIGLVEWVADIGPAPMRVVDGYLYVATRTAPALRAAQAPPRADELEALFDEVRGAIERALAPVEGARPPSLAAALAAYRAVYEAYMAKLAPALAAARAAVRAHREGAAPRESAGAPARGDGAELLESAVARAVRIGDRDAIAALSPVWDVAAPTFGERGDASLPGQECGENGKIGETTRGGERAHGKSVAPGRDLSHVAAAIGEADDLLFARAQRAVRRALIGLAEAWGLSPPDNIFYLPLSLVRARAERGEQVPPDVAREMARSARAARDAQRGRRAPPAFRDGRPIADMSAPGRLDFWRGQSARSGTARGRVLPFEDLGHLADDPRGRVVVAQAVTPAALLALSGAAALVCEQGGVLDHAAALARELGLPCVVGCAGVWRALGADDHVLVDGDAGLVVRITAP